MYGIVFLIGLYLHVISSNACNATFHYLGCQVFGSDLPVVGDQDKTEAHDISTSANLLNTEKNRVHGKPESC